MSDALKAIESAVASVTDELDAAQVAAAIRAVSPALVDDVVFGVASSVQGGTADGVLLGVGMAASPGVGVGRVVTSGAEALEQWDAGVEVVLVVDETSPGDEPAMRVASAIVTRGGGVVSHAAIIARQWGVPAVCGIGALHVEGGVQLLVDGSTGEVRLLDPAVPADPSEHHGPLQTLPAAVQRLLALADGVAQPRLRVLANADTPADVDVARELGAAGVGLCRTEHQFLGERAPLVARALAGDAEALVEMGSRQRVDLAEILERVGDNPVVVRLLDAPSHEFDAGRPERNPMLGWRGVRAAVRHPQLLESQAEALAHAVADRVERGHLSEVGVLVPMVATAEELSWARTLLNDVFFRVGLERGVDVRISVGAMIETPRAALIAGSLAATCDFFSFGTNDLTQLTWGISRDDLDAELVTLYRDRGFIDRSPFETLDGSGVVRLMALASETGRSRNPDLGLAMCGEHGGDPASIAVALQLGLNSVSVSPYRVPAARLAAAHAVLGPARKDPS